MDEERREFDKKWREDMVRELKENTRLTMEMKTILAVHCEGEIATKKELTEVREAVFGNGKPGLKQEQTELKGSVKNLWKILVGVWSFIIMMVGLNWERFMLWVKGG